MMLPVIANKERFSLVHAFLLKCLLLYCILCGRNALSIARWSQSFLSALYFFFWLPSRAASMCTFERVKTTLLPSLQSLRSSQRNSNIKFTARSCCRHLARRRLTSVVTVLEALAKLAFTLTSPQFPSQVAPHLTKTYTIPAPTTQVSTASLGLPPAMERLRPTTWPEGIDEAILKQKKISSHITVHAEYRRETYRREGATLINGIYRDTGCIVMVHWEQTKIKHFDVYAGAGSKKAVAILNTWIAQGSQKSKDSSAWAKTPAFNHAQWYQEQLEQMEDESLEYFLGPTPEVQEGAPVRPKVRIFDWPGKSQLTRNSRSRSTGPKTCSSKMSHPESHLAMRCKPWTTSESETRSSLPC